ncbi:hypothetical protein CHGG_01263 [Chaetomium globosum CBS 148.51]|jgi:hypothetical protein|uniref:Allergen Asp f 4 n=1 Tax=Chaetomium globosum (strain ATCC 6205 / CBS 148.51 / DSM 1962 / NBRC 6347 / NRRL 1970) TaxID=306901 RepID=Q2HEU1_CHAGB|nr:uncharacterized protein CHGG_01263 [Chaetomium globosum CBS 148.51]EAQ93028.1 hypothetical protein CHGG_01263 [Chaetomium globosum CBS 148.51]
MQLTHFLLLAGALGAVAHPSGHAHLHRSVQARGNGPAHVKNVHNKPIPKSAAAKVAEPAASVAPSPSPKPKPSEPTESDEFIPFCGGTSSKSKRVTYEQVMYTGNLGTNGGCKWNSNLMLVPNKIAKKYKYVQEYTNVAKEPYQVICGNKMGADKQLTGMFKVEGQEQLIFTLQPGETKTVVADSNTQGVCAFAPNKVELTIHGQYAGVWAEFDFENTSNEGWSGADCSSLVAQAYDLDVPGCRMSEGGVDSTILAGGIGDNAYTKGMEKLDGIGLNIVPGATVIKVYVGFA